MKKIMLVCACIIQACICVAQDIVNSDMTNYCFPQVGGLYHMATDGSCPYFNAAPSPGDLSNSMNCLNNWIRAFGTPEYVWPGGVLMWGDLTQVGPRLSYDGEGVAANYTFHAGVTYHIAVGIYQFDQPGSNVTTGDGIYLYAANGIVETPYVTTGCGDVPGSWPRQLINTWTSGSVINNIWQMTYTPTSDYNQILIYPTGLVGYSQSTLVIDYIHIYSCVDGTITYDLSSQIAGGNVTEKASITAGSSNSSVVNTDANNTTVFIGQAINLISNFEAQQNDNSYFLAVAVTDCIQKENPNPDPDPNNHHDYSGSSRETEERQANSNSDGVKVVTNNEFAVFPNPASNIVKVSYPADIGNIGEIDVADMSGQSLIHKVISCEGKTGTETIDVTALPPGTYIVSLSGDHFHGIKKLVKL